jgi:hypothetical protein
MKLLLQTYELFGICINPLNAESNPICHLLVLVGDLTFMGPCIVSIFQYTCISNKMQLYTIYLYLETALHVLGENSTHHQKRIQLYLQHLVFVTPLLLFCRYRGKVGTGLSVLWVAYALFASISSLSGTWRCSNDTKHERRPPEDGQTVMTETCWVLIMCFKKQF